MSIKFKITGGPSREELFDALRLYSEERRIQFTLKPPRSKESRELYPKGAQVKRSCRVLSITALAEIPGESWLLSVSDQFGVRELHYRTDARKGNWQ